MREDFCVLILSHNRAGDVNTIDTLERFGYTGDWHIVIDHPDDIEPYENEYGEDKIVYFDKEDTQPELDRGDNLDRLNSAVYARYQSFQIARDLGYDYFILLDDDYNWFGYKFNEHLDYIGLEYVDDLDEMFTHSVEFLENTGVDSLTYAQGGDFIGGKEASLAQGLQTKRKAMNTFVCDANQPYEYLGRINEDVNTYVRQQQLGKLFLMVNFICVDQGDTQQNEGGLTNPYLEDGTYQKSFYTILYSPSSVSLTLLRDRNDKRIHHRVSWRHSVPKIVPESVKQDN